MNTWERLKLITEEGFGTPSGLAPASQKNVRTVKLTDVELDALVVALEGISNKQGKGGVDLEQLEQKLYQAKVRRESMGSGNSTSHGDAGEDESEVEGVY